MIELNDMSIGNIYEKPLDDKGKKLDPSTSKLYNKRINLLDIQEENKSLYDGSAAGLNTSQVDSSYIKNPKGNTLSENKSNKSTLSEKEFEKLRLAEDKQRELTHYYFRNLFIQGSFLQNFLWVDSYINPRHVRGSLWFTNIIFIWYF
jgi:hypothetical protein